MAISAELYNFYKNTATIIGDMTRVLSICRVSLFFNLLFAIYLVFVPQGLDSIINLIDKDEHDFHVLVMSVFFVAALSWATMSWYWPRVLLEITLIDVNRLSETEVKRLEQSKFVNFLHRQVPRVLGSLPLLLVGFAMLKVRENNTSNVNAEQINALLTKYGIGFCLLAIILFLFYVYRRDMANWLHKRLDASFLNKMRFVKALISVLEVAEKPVYHKETMTRLFTMIKPALILIVLSVVLSTTIFIIFCIRPALAQYLTPVNVVLISAPVWLPIGHLLLVFGYSFRFPAFIVLFVFAIVFSQWNDNHTIRTLSDIESIQVKQAHSRLTPSEQMEKWLKTRDVMATDKTYPVYLVAAEGGGIRAAYWSAMLLAKLHELDKDFSQHVFALSGVSGGSVGTGIYVNLLAQKSLTDCQLKLFSTFGCHTHELLKQDFLSPVLSSLLYGDLAQRFLPVAIDTFDRARALESGFEVAWQRVLGNRQLSASFLDLWSESGSPYRVDIPSLILNSTWVETGKRIAISNIKFPAKDFPEMVDYFNVSPQAIRSSTAMHNSARFTFVSPAGAMADKEGKIWGHLVDGGYHDNTGAMSLIDLVQDLEQKLDIQLFKRLRFHVIYIINNSQLEVNNNEHGSDIPTPLEFMKEIGAPVTTLSSIRNSQQNFVRNQLTQYLEKHGGKTYVLQAKQNAPLGWTLSVEATNKLRQDVEALMPELNTITAILK